MSLTTSLSMWKSPMNLPMYSCGEYPRDCSSVSLTQVMVPLPSTVCMLMEWLLRKLSRSSNVAVTFIGLLLCVCLQGLLRLPLECLPYRLADFRREAARVAEIAARLPVDVGIDHDEPG